MVEDFMYKRQNTSMVYMKQFNVENGNAHSNLTS